MGGEGSGLSLGGARSGFMLEASSKGRAHWKTLRERSSVYWMVRL